MLYWMELFVVQARYTLALDAAREGAPSVSVGRNFCTAHVEPLKVE